VLIVGDPQFEIREVADGLRTLTRRLQRREQQLSDAARLLRTTSRRPTFEAPAGDRSRQFVDAQARRLERLAARLGDLRHQLDRLSGGLRPIIDPIGIEIRPEPWKPSFVWYATERDVQLVVARCPSPIGAEWEATSPDDDPESGLRPAPRPVTRPRPPLPNAHGPAWFKPLPPVLPMARTWRLDISAIRAMARDLRRQGDRIASLGTACRREFDDPSGRMPPHLREAIERAGISTGRVCADVDRRLHRHAAALDKKMATPGLLGPGPEYGLSSFGIDHKDIAFDLETEPAFAALVAAGSQWHDRAQELTAIMEWLCRRLPVVFGAPAEAFFELVGVTDSSPPADRPPGRLPPQRYPAPEDLDEPGALVVDPSTSISMTQAEYYQRYGVQFGAKLPDPLLPLPPEEIEQEDDTGNLVDGLLAGAAAGAVTSAVARERDLRHRRRAAREEEPSGREDDSTTMRSSDVSEDRSDESTARGTTDDEPRTLRSPAATEEPTSRTTTGSAPVEAVGAAGISGGTAAPPPPADPDPQLARDAAVAVRRGGVRLGPGAGAALGSVIVGGTTAGVVIAKRNAAKKITNWTQYKAKRRTNAMPADA
jgi:hypothetical protein